MGNGSSVSSQNHALLQVLMLPYKTQICKERKENPILIATDGEERTSQDPQIRAFLLCSLFGWTVTSFASFKCSSASNVLLPSLPTDLPDLFHGAPNSPHSLTPSFCFYSLLQFLKGYESHVYASSHLSMSLRD